MRSRSRHGARRRRRPTPKHRGHGSGVQAPVVSLSAAFSPERLGAGTTVHLGFRITGPDGLIPSPLTELGVLYPAELGIATSSLGLEVAPAAQLQSDGLACCPANSLMGHGSALIDVPFALGPVLEPVRASRCSPAPSARAIWGSSSSADGEAPVIAELIFPGVVLPAQPPFGGKLPRNPAAAGAKRPGKAPTPLSSEWKRRSGRATLTYYRRVHGRSWWASTPRGILLPSVCPHQGFPFTVHMAFQDGAHAEASTTIACPRRHAGASLSAKGRGIARHRDPLAPVGGHASQRYPSGVGLMIARPRRYAGWIAARRVDPLALREPLEGWQSG